jgi:hypothetical protein
LHEKTRAVCRACSVDVPRHLVQWIIALQPVFRSKQAAAQALIAPRAIKNIAIDGRVLLAPRFLRFHFQGLPCSKT